MLPSTAAAVELPFTPVGELPLQQLHVLGRTGGPYTLLHAAVASCSP
jgi:hypothetical protein